jgi:catechol 2,3-dioxygenase-like lactoylglutathione lyase family enzyme
MVELLLELGADVNARDSRGAAPIVYAKSDANPRILELLQRAGANPADRMRNQFGSVTPILNAKNVPASIDYYVNQLGFRKLWDWGTPAVFAGVGRDNVELFLCQGAQGSSPTWMSIFIKDVDALHEEYKRSGAIIRQAPTNFGWGSREMNVADIDGHRFRMSMNATGPGDGISLVED